MKQRPRVPKRLLDEISKESAKKRIQNRSRKLRGGRANPKPSRKETRRALRQQTRGRKLRKATRRPQKHELAEHKVPKTMKNREEASDQDSPYQHALIQSRTSVPTSSGFSELESVDSAEKGDVHEAPTMKYIPPHLRQTLTDGKDHKQESIQRRIRGLLNRISEQNVRGIVDELVGMYNGLGRIFVSSTFSTELIKAVAEGPKVTDQFIGILSATIAAFSALSKAHGVASTFLSTLASAIKTHYAKEDSIGTLNLISLLSHVYLCGLVSSLVVYGLMEESMERMLDLDVTMIHKILQICGLRLRSADPESMKTFIIKLHNRVADISQTGSLSHRADVMLDLVIDIKNNRLSKTGKKETVKNLSPNLGRWLQELEVQKMTLVHLTWAKISNPDNSGQWWLPDSKSKPPEAHSVAIKLSGDLQENGMEVLSLANQQRMNTDLRKRIFCIIMGSQDTIDACEKLIRLSLKGEQDREVIRVLVDCCLQEKRWNPYYSILAAKLCRAKTSHTTTLRFCLKDKLKNLEDLEIRQMDHLAKLLTQSISKEVLSLGLVKSFDLSSELTEKSVFFWRIFYIHLLLSFATLEDSVESVSKLMSSSESFQLFGKKLLVFFQFHFESWILKLNAQNTKWLRQNDYKMVIQRYKELIVILNSII